MALVSGIMLAAAMAAGHSESFTHFDNYTKAFGAAKLVGRPMLVILNPGEADKAVPLTEVRKTQQRRDLLEDYVVCVLDTSTEHGQKCRELFEADALPRVVVIDKDQQKQIFRSSQKLDDQTFTQVLISYRNGVAAPNPVTKRISQPTVSSGATYQSPPTRAPARYSQPCST